jgi:glycosyltransferase involved in cell wall biosynthesis
MELTILMPSLNEVETVETCILKAKTWLAGAGVNGEILIADNGSVDGTPQLAERAGARVISVPILGYGAALQAGLLASQGRYVIMGDADNSYDFSNLDAFLEKLRGNNDLVMGNRFRGGIAPGAMPLHHRYLGNPILTGIGRILFGTDCGDFHCGLRGFNREAILRLDLRTTGMEFASEMVVKASLNGLKITEVPIRLSKDGRSRPPHLRSWRDGWRHLRFLLMYSPRWLFFFPGLLAIFIGLIIGALVLPAPFFLEGIRFDIHSLLFASALIVIGYQAIIFSLFTKTFAIATKMLPPDPAFQAPIKYITLEVGLLFGFLLFLIGTILSVMAFFQWGRLSFGQLDPDVTMRLFIPGLTSLILGVQTIFSSFFLSILGLNHR